MKVLNQKSLGLKIQGSDVTPEMLARINKYALKELTADDVYVRKFLMAHNAIDRDNERFPENLLDDFARTFPGKSFMKVHNKQSLPIGLFFDSAAEEMTPEVFQNLTGETPVLPKDIFNVKVVWGWVYLLKSDFNNEVISNIEAGIYRHASIGFRATDIMAVKESPNGPILYWQYVGPGEATEGSIVWLGAQPGATAIKKYDFEKGPVPYSPTSTTDVNRSWDAAGAKSRIAKWASSDGSGNKEKIDWGKYRKAFAWYDGDSPENFGSYKLPHHDIIDGKLVVVWSGVSAAMAALNGARGGVDIPESDRDAVRSHLSKHYEQYDKEPPKEAGEDNSKGGKNAMLKILSELLGKTLTEDNAVEIIKGVISEKDTKINELEKRVSELSPLAEDGKKYRGKLISDYASLKAKLGDINETPEAQKEVEDVANTYPIAFLENEVKVLQKRVEEKFPDEGKLKGDMRTDKSEDTKEIGKDKKNPLVPQEA